MSGKGKIVCAMSGGVDSSVSAHLLQREGWDVIGMFMRSGASADGSGHAKQGCCTLEDSLDARRVSDKLGIPFYALNFQEAFSKVIHYFMDEYNLGRTPNPCVYCNRHLKFGALWDYAKSLGAEKIATGHYARVEERGGRHLLKRGRDADKDQSYVLFVLSQEQLSRIVFPLADIEKPEVRRIAKELGFNVHDKKDSVEICFVPDDYRDVLKKRNPENIRPGNFVDALGNVIGRHEGYQFFTVGQRRGLGRAFGKPMYVQSINAANAEVVLAEDDALYSRGLSASQPNWIMDPQALTSGMKVLAQIRYNHTPVPAVLEFEKGGVEKEFQIRFDEAERAVTPGQAVVLYEGDYVLGGGWIDSAMKAGAC